jgi:Icc protein
VVGTFQEAVRRITALPRRPAFVIHTGDHVHLSKMAEFDSIRTDRTFNVPGEHNVLVDHGRRYLQMFRRGTRDIGYYSVDYKGVHCNVGALILRNAYLCSRRSGASIVSQLL